MCTLKQFFHDQCNPRLAFSIRLQRCVFLIQLSEWEWLWRILSIHICVQAVYYTCKLQRLMPRFFVIVHTVTLLHYLSRYPVCFQMKAERFICLVLMPECLKCRLVNRCLVLSHIHCAFSRLRFEYGYFVAIIEYLNLIFEVYEML